MFRPNCFDILNFFNMRKLLILALIFTSCEMASTDWSTKSNKESKDKSKSKLYVRKPNTYWKTCEYKDVVEQILSARLEYKLSTLNVDKNFLNEEFYDYYDPKYTKESVLKDIEEEVKDFIRRSAAGGKSRMKSTRTNNTVDTTNVVLSRDTLKSQMKSITDSIPGVTIEITTVD